MLRIRLYPFVSAVTQWLLSTTNSPHTAPRACRAVTSSGMKFQLVDTNDMCYRQHYAYDRWIHVQQVSGRSSPVAPREPPDIALPRCRAVFRWTQQEQGRCRVGELSSPSFGRLYSQQVGISTRPTPVVSLIVTSCGTLLAQLQPCENDGIADLHYPRCPHGRPLPQDLYFVYSVQKMKYILRWLLTTARNASRVGFSLP